MSDRGLLFVFSILMVFAGLGVSGWLLATGQAGTVDGLFLLLTALLLAAAFALYAGFMIRHAMRAAAQTSAQRAKSGAVTAAPKTEPVTAAQS